MGQTAAFVGSSFIEDEDEIDFVPMLLLQGQSRSRQSHRHDSHGRRMGELAAGGAIAAGSVRASRHRADAHAQQEARDPESTTGSS